MAIKMKDIINSINEKIKDFRDRKLESKENDAYLLDEFVDFLYDLNQKKGPFFGIWRNRNQIRDFIKSNKDYYFQFYVATGEEILFRRGYPNENPIGKWFGDKYRSIEEARNELAILAAWDSSLTGEYKVRLKKGAIYLKGIAAPQFETFPIPEARMGGGVQYYIQPNSIMYVF